MVTSWMGEKLKAHTRNRAHPGAACPRCVGTGIHQAPNMQERVCAFCLGARTVAVEKAKAERVRLQKEAKAS
jgi:hypothetical protein